MKLPVFYYFCAAEGWWSNRSDWSNGQSR